jgi:hypothetical protein
LLLPPSVSPLGAAVSARPPKALCFAAGSPQPTLFGLEQYEALFGDNDIDAEVLPILGADDLRRHRLARASEKALLCSSNRRDDK